MGLGDYNNNTNYNNFDKSSNNNHTNNNFNKNFSNSNDYITIKII